MLDGDLCTLIGLAMPLSLQSAVQSLCEGVNSSHPNHWMTSLMTSWAGLKSACESEVTYAAKRAATHSPPAGGSHANNRRNNDTCHKCQRTGHYARDCPTLTPEDRARRQEQYWRRRESPGMAECLPSTEIVKFLPDGHRPLRRIGSGHCFLKGRGELRTCRDVGDMCEIP